VIGVVLSGCNDDGTAGLAAIKRCGGMTVVQDPAEAQEPVMPRSALRGAPVDHCLSLAGIGELLAREAGRPAPARQPVPEDLVREHSASFATEDAMSLLHQIGTPSTIVCPDCGGTLFQLGDQRPMRFRCHTGHAYTVDSLNIAQKNATEDALWAAIRALQEREGLVRQLAELDRVAGDERTAQDLDRNAERLRDHVTRLRELVEKED
jgi:two-component system chemotaxis response regulator CheB